jgi:hypothetical protein
MAWAWAAATDGDRSRGDSRRRRRAWEAVAVSLVFHAVVFLAIGLIVPRPVTRFLPDNPPVNITLLPPMPREHVHHAKAQSEHTKSPVSSGAARPALAVHAPVNVRPDAPPSPITAAPSPTPGSGASAAAENGTSKAPAPLPYEDGNRGVRAFLRGTVGCDYGPMAHLTAEEKARCAERFANIEKHAPEFSGIPGEKLSGFMAEAAANARKQQYREGTGPRTVVPCQGVGSNFGVGCLPEEAIHHYHN